MGGRVYLISVVPKRLAPILCRSGVAPPTGTIHPRESRGTADRKQESIKRSISGGCPSRFGIVGGDLAGVDRSGRGCNPRPAPGRTIHPRESRGTADRKQESIKRSISGRCPSRFGIAGGDLAGVDRSGRGCNPRPAPGRTIHPRESRGTADRKQKSIKRSISGGCPSRFGIVGEDLAGVDRSGRGFNPRPAQGRRLKAGTRPA